MARTKLKDPAIAAIVLAMIAASPFSASAEIKALRCRFDGLEFFITMYDDGSPTRLGTSVGVGDRARVYPDRRTGALVIVEENADSTPITMTTIQPDHAAVHSRHVIGLAGDVVAPQQLQGRCSPSPL